MVNTSPKSISTYLALFFKRYRLLRNVLIALGISLLLVASIVATITTLGAAAPALGVSWGAVTVFFGSPLITWLVGSVGVVSLTGIGAGLIKALNKLFESKQPVAPSSPPYYSLASIPHNSPGHEQSPIDATTPRAGVAAIKTSLEVRKRVSKGKSTLENQSVPKHSLDFESTLNGLGENGDGISANLDLTALSRLTLTNKAFRKMFEGKLLQAKLEQTAKLEQAAYWIITEPDENKIEKLLAANPELLRKKIKEINDPSGRQIRNVTLLQLAFGSGNARMCNVMQKHFEKMHGGDSRKSYYEMYQQLKGKFDDEMKIVNEDNVLQQLPTLLENIIQAITDDPLSIEKKDENRKIIIADRTAEAINTFRGAFAQLLPKIINNGMHFCPKILTEACSQYTTAKYLWKEYHPAVMHSKCALFEDAVIATILQYVPAHDARCFSQGLNKLSQDEVGWLGAKCAKFYRHLRSPSPEFSIDGTGIDITCGSPRAKGRLSDMVRRKSVDDSANNFSIDNYLENRHEGLQSFMKRCIQKSSENTAVLANANR